MKTLFIARHAKSSWKEHGLTDFDRPLNKRGERDAPFMGELLAKRKLKPDLIISSPAKRAITTAKIIAVILDYKGKNILMEEKIYEAGIGNLIKLINGLPDEKDIVMMFGHNPGFTMLSNYLTSKYIDNIPTCGIVEISFRVDSWNDIADSTGEIISFEYPKKYLE